MKNNRKHSYVCNRFICWIKKVFPKVAFYVPNSGKHPHSGYHSNTWLILEQTRQTHGLLARPNLHNTFTMHSASYSDSPELYLHPINHCSCIPDATSAAASVWLCGQPAMTLKGKYQRPLPSDGSKKSFFPCYAVNLNQGSQIPALTLVILSRPVTFGGGILLLPVTLGLSERVLQAPQSIHHVHRGVWLEMLHLQHSSKFVPEKRPPPPKKKKNLTSYLKKEERNAENESTKMKTQEAAF